MGNRRKSEKRGGMERGEEEGYRRLAPPRSLTGLLWESNPVASCAILLNEVSELLVLFRRPGPLLHIRLVAAWSPSHVSGSPDDENSYSLSLSL